MRTFFRKAILGLCASLSILSATNEAKAADPRDGGYFEFQLSGQQQTCLGAWGGVPNNGTQMIQYSCNPTTAARDQALTFDTNDCVWENFDGTWYQYCSIRSGKNFNKCMGTYAGSGNPGAFAVEWDCLGQCHQDQYWLLEPGGDGSFVFWNLFSGLALGVANITDVTNCAYLWFDCTTYVIFEEGLVSQQNDIWIPVPATP